MPPSAGSCGWAASIIHATRMAIVYNYPFLGKKKEHLALHRIRMKAPNSDRELVSEGRNCLWLMRCSSLHKEGSLEAFAARFESSEPVLNSTDWSFSNPGY